jgi:hypothetical protein
MERLFHEIKRQRRDQHAAPEGHHRRDQPLRHTREVGDERAEYQSGAAQESPQSGLDGERHRIPFQPGRSDSDTLFENGAFAATMGDLARHPQKIGTATYVKDVF